MKDFLKLIHYEFARLRFFYLSLMAVTLLLQFGGLILFVRRTVEQIQEIMVIRSLSPAQYAEEYHLVSFFDYTEYSLWFIAPIALCVTALLIYVFLIWYRDWWGKNMFIYRLLMLPNPRMYLFGAKLTVILLAVLGLVAFQMLILPAEQKVFDWLMPMDFRQDISFNEIILNHMILSILIPNTFFDFVLSYAAGACGVILIFTAILMERSFRWKGIVAGIIYCAAACVVFFLPMILAESTSESYFYPIELFWMTVGTGILITAVSIWLSFYLLKNKVSV